MMCVCADRDVMCGMLHCQHLSDLMMCVCADRDVMCGMLHCQHLSEKLMFWKEALAFTMPEAWVLVNNTRHDCKGAILDVGLYMHDPGMVPDGAKCAERHVSY